MLITMALITCNIYNSVNGPLKRKISYIEIWMVIVLTPLLIAIAEYGLLLFIKKYYPKEKLIQKNQVKSASMRIKNEAETNMEEISKILDFWTFILVCCIIMISNAIFWSVAFS